MAGYFQMDRSTAQALLPAHGTTYTQAEAYLFLSSYVAFTPKDEVIGGKLISLNVGELCASERYLQSRWSWGRTKVRNFKSILSSKGILNQRKDQGETILILCNTMASVDRETIKRTTKHTTSEPETNQRRTNIIINKKEKRTTTPPPSEKIKPSNSVEEVAEHIKSIPENPSPYAEQSGMHELMIQVNTLRPHWGKPAAWSYQEQSDLSSTSAQMAEMDANDWKLIKDFLNTPLGNQKAYWQPNNRSKFVSTFADVFSSAQRWVEKHGRSSKQTETNPQNSILR